MPCTQTKKLLMWLGLSLTVIAAVICLIAFMLYHHLAAWRCPPREVASLAEIPTVGGSLSAWHTTGPVYYRYRPGFGEGCCVAVAGVTSPEAITAFQAVARDRSRWDGVAQKRVNEAVEALSSVPEFAFRHSKENKSFCWLPRGKRISVLCASFDPRSRWFVAMVDSGSDWDAQ